MSSVLPPGPSASFPLPADGGSYRAALSPAPRPNLVRRETDQILSYYQSEHAGRAFDYATAAHELENAHPSEPSSTTTHHHEQRTIHTRKQSTVSTASEYSSHYSSESLVPSEPASESQVPTPVRASAQPPSDPPRAHGNPARHSRRPSVPTEGGADRRRLAIVEMDSATALTVGRKRSRGLKSKASLDSASSAMSASTLHSRRGVHLGGLALVAPPDASPRTYTDLTPPTTAPLAERASHPPPSSSSHYHAHARSASEAVDSGSRARLRHKGSRDVGIVGLSSASTASDSLGPASPTSDEYHTYVQHEGLGVPLFQTPAKSRSPSPGGGTTPDLSDTSSASAYHRSPEQYLLATPIFAMEDGIVTPGIGEYKDIRQPVVGPVIVGLSPELMQRTQRPDGTAASQHHSHHTSTTSPHSPTTASPSYQSPTTSTSPYLHYRPGVDATAGPLPPPPRSIFDASSPPPRPPRFHTPVPHNARREIEAIKEKLQLPQSVSAALAARTPSETNKRLGHDPSPSRSDTRDSEESAYSQDNESSVKLVPSNSVHRREGAFPPSTILTSPPGQPLVQSPRASEEESLSSHADHQPLVVIEREDEGESKEAADDTPVRERKDSDRRAGLELRRESSWVSLRQEASENRSSPNGKSAALPNASISRSSSSVSGVSSSSSSLPVPPPKNGRSGSDDEKPASLAPSSFRATLTNLKRFSSLPRTPSRSSRSSKRSASPSPGPDVRRSLSPSGTPILVELPPRRVIPRPTKVSAWPAAMNTRDVTDLRSPRERAKAYAEKINELAMYDCGLREWMASQGRPGSHSKAQSQRTTHHGLQPTVPAEMGGMPPQGRHVSHGSLASQATFPIRADAYTATDLSTRPIDVVPSNVPPPTLPYPALAQAGVSRAQTRTSTLLSSPTKTLAILPGSKGPGTGFFASLGRKTSVRREKGLSGLASSPQSPTKVLTKRPPAMAASRSNPTPPTATSPRDAPPPTAPAIPGGPRAAPGRIQRAKTYSVSASPPTSDSPPESSPQNSQRQSAVARRPSLFARARPAHTSVVPAAPAAVDPAFQRQVDKLAAILPHADRAILAGYLRRAGEDILAIGQYLEDEKNGTLRRD